MPRGRKKKEVLLNSTNDVLIAKVDNTVNKSNKYYKKVTECLPLEKSENVKLLKHLGYCSNPVCNGFVTSGDYVKGVDSNILRCVRCGFNQDISDLLVTKKTERELYMNLHNIDLEDDVDDVDDDNIVDLDIINDILPVGTHNLLSGEFSDSEDD